MMYVGNGMYFVRSNENGTETWWDAVNVECVLVYDDEVVGVISNDKCFPNVSPLSDKQLKG